MKKLDLLLTDIQHQVDDLQQQMANLRVVRTQLARYQHENGGKEESVPQIHMPIIGIYAEV